MLTNDDTAFYREHGYLVVPGVLEAAEVDRLKAAADEFVDRSRAVLTHSEMFDLEHDHGPRHPRLRRVKTPHLFDPRFASMVAHAGIVDILRPLIGPNIRFDNSKLNFKMAAGGAPVGWHQDWAFYPHTNDDLCAVGIMIDPVDAENGPMLVVPGSHKGPVWDQHAVGRFSGAITDPAAVAEYASARPMVGPAGSVSIHHVRAVHGSAPNRTARSRRFLLLQFRAADAWPLTGVTDIAAFDALLRAGAPSLAPRLADVPVRMPLPPASHPGSIFENQRAAPAAAFADTVDARGERRATAGE